MRAHKLKLTLAVVLKPTGVDMWTEAEDAILARYAGKETVKDVLARLPGRTRVAAAWRASRRGLSLHDPAPLKPSIDVVAKVYREGGIRALQSAYPDRTEDQLRTLVERHGLRTNVMAPRTVWTAEMDDVLRAHYARDRSAVRAGLPPGISAAAIRMRAYRLGLGVERPNPLSAADVSRAKRAYARGGFDGLQKALPEQPASYLFHLIQKHGWLTRVRRAPIKWTAQMDAALRRDYPLGGSAAVMEAFPGVPRRAVCARAYALNVRFQKPDP